MSNHRASLLSGLRTGGVRSSSNPAQIPNAPLTAAIGGQFPYRLSSFAPNNGIESQNPDQFFSDPTPDLSHHVAPMTASALDGNGFANMQQQHAQAILLQAQMQAQAMQRAFLVGQAHGNRGISPDSQAIQLQIDLLKLQACRFNEHIYAGFLVTALFWSQALQQQQQQQFQAQMLAQAQLQQQLQSQQQNQSPRRRPSESVTAGVASTMVSLPNLARSRNVSGMNMDSDVPPTPAIDGRFPPTRATSGLNPNAATFKMGDSSASSVISNSWRLASNSSPTTPSAHGQTSVISGGTSLGAAQSKHDAATSWRRPSLVTKSSSEWSTVHSIRGTSPTSSPPSVYLSTPEETSPTESGTPQSTLLVKPRPVPLRFHLPTTLQDAAEDDMEGQVLVTCEDDGSRESTPTSGTSSPSSAREEASKRLYEGLGIGRPTTRNSQSEAIKQVSVPSRQPRGPPSGVEELGSRNFAARIRRKAIGGLGSLMDARNRRVSTIEVRAF